MTALPWRDLALEEGKPVIPTSLLAEEKQLLETFATREEHSSVLEVGSAYGYSAIAMALAGAGRVITIDPHDGYGAMPDSLATLKNNLRLYGVQDLVEVRVGLSTEILPAIRQEAQRFDLIFIDGDHRYDAVVTDVMNALPLMWPDVGIVACHDYGEDTCPDVARALDYLMLSGQIEFVDQVGTIKLIKEAK